MNKIFIAIFISKKLIVYSKSKIENYDRERAMEENKDLYEYFVSRCFEEEDNNKRKFFSSLLNLVNKVIEDTKLYLNDVTVQVPAFASNNDKDKHYERIMSNIFQILYNKLELHNPVELSFYILMSYLHNCGVALPKWERRILLSTEGSDRFFDDNELVKSIHNDGKINYTFDQAKSYIVDNEAIFWKSSKKIENFIFDNDNKEDCISQLSSELINYQDFRNGFSNELNKISNRQDYLKRSREIRYEYLRITRADRAERYIINAGNKFSDILEGTWGNSIADDLASVCRSYCENLDYSMNLSEEASYYGYNVNLKFASMVLRLADVLHYSDDRINMSYYAEKMLFTYDGATLHWLDKYGVTYKIVPNNLIKIIIDAYCKEPDLYYFLEYHIACINTELEYFMEFSEKYKDKGFLDKYYIPVEKSVDKKSIRYNNKNFEPVQTKGFVLEQKEIIKLLMSIDLYKNKNLCIRELYQNSLDACRCMVSEYDAVGIKGHGTIEFGIKRDSKGTYLYCLDNGIGMSRDVIDKYFLNIGKSYYNSSEYQRLQINNHYNFKPISNFGIGILSCFMLGSYMEVITISKLSSEKTHFAINSIDANAYVYRMAFTFSDEKLVGIHGTLVKIYLNDHDEFENSYPDSVESKINMYVNDKKKDTNTKNLFLICNYIIGIQDNNVEVFVGTKCGRKKLLNYNEFVFSTYFNLQKNYIVSGEIDDIEIFTKLSLPTCIDIPSQEFFHTKFGSIELVDGIVVEGTTINDSSLCGITNIINIKGKHKPNLSIDRRNITYYSKELYNIVVRLTNHKIVELIVKNIITHYNIYKPTNNQEMFFKNLVELTLQQFASIGTLIIDELLNTTNMDIILNDSISVNSLRELINIKDFEMYTFNYIDRIAALCILDKLYGAEIIINDFGIIVKNANINIEFKNTVDRNEFIIVEQYYNGYDYCSGFSSYFISPNMLKQLLLLDNRRNPISTFILNFLENIYIYENHEIETTCRYSNQFYIENLNYYYCPYIYVDPTWQRTNTKNFSNINKDFGKELCEGWSILFLGDTKYYVILSGKHNISELINIIPKNFFPTHPGKYILTDGKSLN